MKTTTTILLFVLCLLSYFAQSSNKVHTKVVEYKMNELAIIDSSFIHKIKQLTNDSGCPIFLKEMRGLFAMDISLSEDTQYYIIFIEGKHVRLYNMEFPAYWNKNYGFFDVSNNLFVVSGKCLSELFCIQTKKRTFKYKEIIGKELNGKIIPVISDYNESSQWIFKYKNGEIDLLKYY